MSTITEIAQELKDIKEKIILVYAFNATGKTRLSVEYKNITKNPNNGRHSGVYYNAFSEDLFVWDNDEPHNNENIKLDIIPSSLNQFHSLLLDTDILEETLSLYQPRYKFKLNLYEDEDREKGIHSIKFYLSDENTNPIKISRGEERIFIWCFFVALFETDSWAGIQDAHFFIDDPVSSMDDHNIFLTAESISKLIEDSFPKKKIIVTTHHIGLFSILYDRLCKGEKSDKYKKNSNFFMLKRQEEELTLKPFGKEVFLYHLHLLQVLSEAKKELFTFHFVLLRQLLETIASFFGTSQLKILLRQIAVDDPENTILKINSLSHKNVFIPKVSEMNEDEAKTFNEVFDKLISKYNFKF
ncbi:AAA family ATPase [Flavobacterium psychrotolerans]|uniref:Anticodon nuclease n=1 Tax=Flavobacterium psychrotolerans TaxID=2169410 RepID=A0A2U1JJD6_9FLAO|nr:AAA family ATPase [Flavobacterium psychrotolerans]PWA05252.1 anticodon nuclease [Flavobacterium psychrotolerans]